MDITSALNVAAVIEKPVFDVFYEKVYSGIETSEFDVSLGKVSSGKLYLSSHTKNLVYLINMNLTQTPNYLVSF